MKMNTILCGDSLKLLETVPAGAVDLVFADPPYNIGYAYDTYDDDRPAREFVEWCGAWMRQLRRVLKDDGAFYLAIGDDFAAELRILGREAGFTLRNWIIWHYAFGQNMARKFARSHTHIFYFVCDPKQFTFNDRLLRFPSLRHTEYQDLRADPRGRLPHDVWDEFPRLCGTFKERDGLHGCQLPEALLTRIILASSNQGELVLDQFVVTGTTAAVAKKLGRRFLGMDLSEEYARRAQQRVDGVACELGAAPDAEGRWPAMHLEMLQQLYRETKVSWSNLRDNEVALRVIAASLRERTGHTYSEEDVTERLDALAAAQDLPKLPNDRPFTARSHVKTEGKRYDRKVLRTRGRARSRDEATLRLSE